MTITMQVLPAGKLSMFKLAPYRQFNAAKTKTDAKDSDHWAGLYMSPHREVAIGYGPVSGEGERYMLEMWLLSQSMMLCDDNPDNGSSASGLSKLPAIRTAIVDYFKGTAPVKATDPTWREIEQQLISREAPLMATLGKLGYFYRCIHDDEGNTEVIVPNSLSHRLSSRHTSTITFRGGLVVSEVPPE